MCVRVLVTVCTYIHILTYIINIYTYTYTHTEAMCVYAFLHAYVNHLLQAILPFVAITRPGIHSHERQGAQRFLGSADHPDNETRVFPCVSHVWKVCRKDGFSTRTRQDRLMKCQITGKYRLSVFTVLTKKAMLKAPILRDRGKMSAQLDAHTHAYKHSHTHTHTHMCKYTHIHTARALTHHTHTKTQTHSPSVSLSHTHTHMTPLTQTHTHFLSLIHILTQSRTHK